MIRVRRYAGVMPVDTKSVKDFRKLSFGAPAVMWTEIERLAAAERAGTLRRTGNWTLGQILGHLATWIDFAYDGYPPELNPPWFIKLILKLQKKRFMRGPLPTGVRIPKVEGGTYGTEPLSLEEGLFRLRKSWERLDEAPPSHPNIIFGPMSHEEWKTVHLRHAELHLGFLLPR